MTTTITAWPSRKTVDLANLTIDMIDIRDVAHHLAGINRYVGGTREYFDVAKHCIIGSYFAQPWCALEFLCHDNHEAYYGDLTSPLKSILRPLYQPLTDRCDALMAQAWGLRTDAIAQTEIARVDALMLKCEMRVFKNPSPELYDPIKDCESPVEVNICRKLQSKRPFNAAGAFIHRFHELQAERHIAALKARR